MDGEEPGGEGAEVGKGLVIASDKCNAEGNQTESRTLRKNDSETLRINPSDGTRTAISELQLTLSCRFEPGAVTGVSFKPTMRPIIAYCLCASENPDKLSDEVNILLRSGYELYGSPSVSLSDSESNGPVFRYIQAVVDYAEGDSK